MAKISQRVADSGVVVVTDRKTYLGKRIACLFQGGEYEKVESFSILRELHDMGVLKNTTVVLLSSYVDISCLQKFCRTWNIPMNFRVLGGAFPRVPKSLSMYDALRTEVTLQKTLDRIADGGEVCGYHNRLPIKNAKDLVLSMRFVKGRGSDSRVGYIQNVVCKTYRVFFVGGKPVVVQRVLKRHTDDKGDPVDQKQIDDVGPFLYQYGYKTETLGLRSDEAKKVRESVVCQVDSFVRDISLGACVFGMNSLDKIIFADDPDTTAYNIKGSENIQAVCEAIKAVSQTKPEDIQHKIKSRSRNPVYPLPKGWVHEL